MEGDDEEAGPEVEDEEQAGPEDEDEEQAGPEDDDEDQFSPEDMQPWRRTRRSKTRLNCFAPSPSKAKTRSNFASS